MRSLLVIIGVFWIVEAPALPGYTATMDSLYYIMMANGTEYLGTIETVDTANRQLTLRTADSLRLQIPLPIIAFHHLIQDTMEIPSLRTRRMPQPSIMMSALRRSTLWLQSASYTIAHRVATWTDRNPVTWQLRQRYYRPRFVRLSITGLQQTVSGMYHTGVWNVLDGGSAYDHTPQAQYTKTPWELSLGIPVTSKVEAGITFVPAFTVHTSHRYHWPHRVETAQAITTLRMTSEVSLVQPTVMFTVPVWKDRLRLRGTGGLIFTPRTTTMELELIEQHPTYAWRAILSKHTTREKVIGGLVEIGMQIPITPHGGIDTGVGYQWWPPVQKRESFQARLFVPEFDADGTLEAVHSMVEMPLGTFPESELHYRYSLSGLVLAIGIEYQW